MSSNTTHHPSLAPSRPLGRVQLPTGWTDPRVVAAFVGLLLVIAVWASTAMLIKSIYSAAERQAAATTQELMLTYEARALRALREIDHALRTVQYALDTTGNADALRVLRERDLLPPELLFSVGVADAAGAVVASTRAKHATNVAQEDFFTGAGSRDEMFVAKPRRVAGDDEWKLLFSRRLQRRDGSFGGIVFIDADAAYFTSSYSVSELGQDGLLALIGTDHVVRVARMGDVISSGDSWQSARIASLLDESAPPASAQLGGAQRFLSARKLNGYPVVVMVGLSRDEQLGPVSARSRSYVAIALLVSILLIGVFAALARLSWKLVTSRAREQQIRLTAARESGMAEIATNVLHNVGNALNSVNVSATLVADSIKKSKVSGLARAVALMREQEGRLGEFFGSDSRGKQLPGYLQQLAESLHADQASSIEHLDALQQNVEHIKKIVMMQQMLATAAAVKEEVDLVELFEASLQMNADALGRHSVQVVRDFESAPPVVLDKHGVLQILVNLISNAKHACSESGRTDRLITLKVRRRTDGIAMSVADNGVGIPAENLTRIFQHGFTTRATGHGFGLHSSALTAKELGGSLHGYSEGVGLGATFTLLVPLPAGQANS